MEVTQEATSDGASGDGSSGGEGTVNTGDSTAAGERTEPDGGCNGNTDKDALGSTDGSLMTEEGRAKGSVGFSLIVYYALAMGGCCFLVPQALLFIAERVSYVGTDWWLSVWTSSVNGTPINDLGLGLPPALPMENTRFYMY